VNPISQVQKQRVPQGLPRDWLRLHEAPAVLAALSPRWRPLFATAIYAGIRKGELLALRKTDVDLMDGLILVQRSGSRDTTKGGHADAIPIHPELAPYLVEAIRRTPSELVFPHVCSRSCRPGKCTGPGNRMGPDVRLEDVLRRALGRARIVLGYAHVCRGRRGLPCGHREQHPDDAPRRCPAHGLLLWPKPIVRPVRFHDLRHTAASLFLQANVPLHVVQKLLRHRDPKLTANVYGHFAPDYMRAEMARFTLGPLAASLLPPALPSAADVPSAAYLQRLRQDSNLLPPASKAGALSR